MASSDCDTALKMSETIKRFTINVQEGKEVVAGLAKEVKEKEEEVAGIMREVEAIAKVHEERRKRCRVLRQEISRSHAQRASRKLQIKAIHNTVSELTNTKAKLSARLTSALDKQHKTFIETHDLMNTKNTQQLTALTPEVLLQKIIAWAES